MTSTAAVQSPEDVINIALRKCGYKLRVNSIMEGSAASKIALDIYSQTRDAILRKGGAIGRWDFAQQYVAGTPTGQTPPPPWSHEYTYPANCLGVRNIFDPTYIADENNPLPYNMKIGNNAMGNRVIWCDVASATLVITAQITDPTQWDVGFVMTFASALATQMAPGLVPLEILKPLMEQEGATDAMAEDAVG